MKHLLTFPYSFPEDDMTSVISSSSASMMQSSPTSQAMSPYSMAQPASTITSSAAMLGQSYAQEASGFGPIYHHHHHHSALTSAHHSAYGNHFDKYKMPSTPPLHHAPTPTYSYQGFYATPATNHSAHHQMVRQNIDYIPR